MCDHRPPLLAFPPIGTPSKSPIARIGPAPLTENSTLSAILAYRRVYGLSTKLHCLTPYLERSDL